MSTKITAYLSDGRSIAVPKQDVDSWKYEVENGDTTTSLADWYTEGGEEHADQIKGHAVDSTRCDHQFEHGYNTPTVRVGSPSEVRLARVCGRRACILDALAWVERADAGREAGLGAVWHDAAGVAHINPPEDDVDLTVLPVPVKTLAQSTVPVADLSSIVADPERGVISLVGGHGGLALITGPIESSGQVMGALAIDTEHGTVYLDPEDEATISEER